MIAPSDIATQAEVSLARRVIRHARTIAPCLNTLDGDDRDDAIAILVGVFGEAKNRGSRLVKSQRIGPASVDYGSADSWFSTDDRSSLRALCGGPVSGGSLGSFPQPARAISSMWPENEGCR